MLTSKSEIETALEQLRSHNLADLFIHSLGWSEVETFSSAQLDTHQVSGQKCIPIAQKESVVVWQVLLAAKTSLTPDLRRQIYQALSSVSSASSSDPLVIFSTADKRRSLWCQSARDSAVFVVGQPTTVWLFRLHRLAKKTQGLRWSETEEVLQNEVFEQLVKDIEGGVEGIESASDRQLYSLLTIQRLIFVQQLQISSWLDSDTWYLQTRFGETLLESGEVDTLVTSSERRQDRFFKDCLQPLFTALSLPKIERPLALQDTVGKVPFIGLFFQKNSLEEACPNATIRDSAFENVLGWLSEQSSTHAFNPWINGALGCWLERYWRYQVGYEPIASAKGDWASGWAKALCACSLDTWLLRQLGLDSVVESDQPCATDEQTLNTVLFNANEQTCRRLVQEILPELKIVDICCSGGYLLAAFHQRLTEIHGILAGYIQQNKDAQLKIWHSDLAERSGIHPPKTSVDSSGIVLKTIQERILKNMLYGITASSGIAQSARFYLLLHFVATAQNLEELEPLIDLEFSVVVGNALVGLVTVDEERFDQVNASGSVLQGNLLQPLAADSYQRILREKNVALEYYQSRSRKLAETHNIPSYARASLLREDILGLDRKAQQQLDTLLLNHMSQQLGVSYRESQLTDKPLRRSLTLADVRALAPFHWGYHFNAVIKRGGFDIVVCLPPTGALKSTKTEFALINKDLVAKKALSLSSFKTSKQALKQIDSEVAQAWLSYQDYYAYLSEYLSRSELFQHQRPSDKEEKNRYQLDRSMLFLEQCFNLLTEGGLGGVVLPAEISKDDRVRSLLRYPDISVVSSRADDDTHQDNEVDTRIITWTKQTSCGMG